MLKNIIYIICFVALWFTFLILAKNTKSKSPVSNKLFTVLTGLMGIWITFLWVADDAGSTSFARVCLNFAVVFLTLVSWVFLQFAISYPNTSKIYKTIFAAGIIYNIFYIWLAFNSKIIPSVKLTPYGSSITQSSIFYSLHELQAYSFILFGIILLNIKKRHFENIEKSRINLMTLGIIITFLGNFLAGTLAIYIPGQTWLNLVATASTVSFVVVIGYTIIRHKLFDVRAIVARFVGYLLSLGLVASLSSFLLFTLSDNFNSLGIPKRAQEIFNVIVILGFAIAYQPLKKRFDRITRRIFYRDGYETQELLDDFNKTLVSTIDLQKLLAKSSEVIEKYLKSEFCEFGIGDFKSKEIRNFGSNVIKLEMLLEIWKQSNHIRKRILVTDSLSERSAQLRALLTDQNVGVLMPLYKTESGQSGFLLLGVKKSGGAYSKQDLAVIEILANELVIAVQNALRFEEIQKFNITLQDKIDEATHQLRRANQRLKALDESKDDFISMASHQLRTPLTSVKGYLSMVLDGDAGKVSSNQKKFLGQAFNSSQRMVFLIADLLNVSRLKTGKFIIERAPTNLADVIKDEITQLKETAQTKNLELIYHKPDHFPTLSLDETKTRQVIMNFMDNAIYYTPSGGSIELKLEDKPKSIEFKVIDTGIGVPKSEEHHLFTKFYRAGNARKARPDGTGLGLFMAKKVIIAEGGALIFQTKEGEGSTFGFSFPKDHMLANNTKS
jgi:signal transduction histidine kinase